MKVLVLGAGAVGLTVAAKLSEHCDVHVVCREHHAFAIKQRGFRMTGLWGEGHFRLSASTDVPEGERFDYVLVTCKGPDTRMVCERFGKAFKGAEAVSLQNGLGNEEIIRHYADHVIGGTIITGFEWREHAAVHVSVEAGPIKLGRFPDGLDKPVEDLVAAFDRVGIAAEATGEIRAALWSKTLYNCALNPLGAVMGTPYGALADVAAWNIIESAIAEAFAVLEAEGVRLPWPTAEDYLEHLAHVQLPATREHHSSMLQDIERGKTTEIDFMNGAVVARGKARGVPTPVNATLVDLIRFKEALR